MILVKVPWLPSAKKNFTTWAITISPVVFVLREHAENKALLAHEQKHQDQVKIYGWWTFYWNYCTNPGFRRSVEAEGYAVQHSIEKGGPA